MKTITVNNIDVPALGFGTWQATDEECIKAIEIALDHGYRHVDTAQIYENEAQVGQGIKNSPVDREDIFLTTKVWMDQVSDGALQASVEESLKKLGTDYVDLLLIHWPVEDVDFAETMKALAQVHEQGKTRLMGVSNFTVEQLTKVKEEIGANIVNNQVEYHPYLDQSPVLDFVRNHNMFMTAYSPIARGKVLEDKVLQEIAETHGKDVTQIVLHWLIAQDRVCAIPKSATEKHIKSNFDIFDFELTADETARINALQSDSGRLINPEWAPDWDLADAA
jgi:2,5-diketo-D-gluconate reductase B